MDYKELSHITINNKQFSKEEILIMPINGESHLDDVFRFLKSWFDENKNIPVQTSGSTGKPKQISIPKQSFVESAMNTCDYLKLGEQTKALLCIPVKYIGGKMMVIRALVAGYNLVVQEPSSSPLLNSSEKINFIALTPMQAKNSLDNYPLEFEKIDTVIIGGGAVSEEFNKEIESLKNTIYSTFGMTETVSHIGLRTLNGKNRTDFYQVFPAYSISKNENNCLVIACPTLSSETITTNDIVEIKDSSFKFLGRLDNVINTGGIKVFPEEIEKQLAPFMNGETFYITSKKNELLGEKVVLISENNSIILEEVKTKNHGLSSYSFPKEMLIKKIELTESGKIMRRKY